jgi:hypothetical protein
MEFGEECLLFVCHLQIICFLYFSEFATCKMIFNNPEIYIFVVTFLMANNIIEPIGDENRIDFNICHK